MILADHCVFATTIRVLQEQSYTTTMLKEITRPNVPDAEVLRLALERDLVLLTNDKGFGDIRAYPPSRHEGIIVLRIEAETETQVHEVLLRLLTERSREELRHKLVVVDHAKYRVRSGPAE